MGKFLAYIPITIFGVLASGLVLAITVNSALYLLFVRERKDYVESDTVMEYATPEERELLTLEREKKTKIDEAQAPLRTRVIHQATEGYKRILLTFLENTFLRRLSIFLPLVFFIFGIIFLAPKVGFELFPSDDAGMGSFTVEAPVGTTTETMVKRIGDWSVYFHGYPEVEYVSATIAGNTATFSLQLTKKNERKKLKQRDIFTLEKIFLNNLSPLESQGLKVTSNLASNGPPGGKAVGINLISDDAKNLSELIATSREYITFIKTLPGTKNVSSTSQDTPGQFIFRFKKDVMADAGISPAAVSSQISQNMNGIMVGTVEDNGDDMDVLVKIDSFLSGANMDDVLDIPITVGNAKYRAGDLLDVTAQNAVASIQRKDGKIQITVDADLDFGMDTVATQAKIDAYALTYKFPPGISSEK